jgi:hypothetical protein
MTKEVEKQAYLMINAYGKAEAEKIANERADEPIEGLSSLSKHELNIATSRQGKAYFWLAVANAIKNWNAINN